MEQRYSYGNGVKVGRFTIDAHEILGAKFEAHHPGQVTITVTLFDGTVVSSPDWSEMPQHLITNKTKGGN